MLNHRSLTFLICHRGALGDFLLTWPAVNELREVLHSWRFRGIGRPEYMELAHAAGLIDGWENMESARLIDFFEGRAFPPGMPACHGAAIWLKQGEPAARLVSGVASGPVCVLAPFPGHRIHVARYHLNGVRSCLNDFHPGPPVMGADHYSFRYPQRRKGHYAVIHPGSGSPSKNYSPACYRAMADDLRRTGVEEVVFLLGPAEPRALEDCVGDERIVRPSDICDLAAWLAGAALFVGNDSGVSHLAGMMGTPTIALYKHTDPHVWGVIGPRVQWIRAADDDSAIRKTEMFLSALKVGREVFRAMNIPEGK